MADDVSDRERANFCGYFTAAPAAGVGAQDRTAQVARSELDALFGLPPADNSTPSGPDKARRQLDELFRGKVGN